MKLVRRFALIIMLFAWGLALFIPTKAFGYAVPPLPEDNLIKNPWFRSTNNPTIAGFDSWNPVLTDGVTWGLDQKESNPSPDILVTKRCNFNEVYCGTGARWANLNDQDGTGAVSYPGVDVYLNQVVQADAANRKLKYSMYWVNHKLDIAEVKVYGSDNSSGAWQEVWIPFSLSQDDNPPPSSAPGRNGVPWFYTGDLATILKDGYSYYKIEIHARYPEADSRQGDVGIKITGIYFSAEFTNEPEKLSTPFVVYNPTVDPLYTGGNASQATTPPLTQESTPQRVRTQNPTVASPTREPSSTSIRQTPTPSASIPPLTPVPSQTEENKLENPASFLTQNGVFVGFILGLLTVGLILLSFTVIKRVTRKD